MGADTGPVRAMDGVSVPVGDDISAPDQDGETATSDTKERKKRRAMLPVVVGDGIQIESDGGALQATGVLGFLSLWGPATPARYLSAQLVTGKRLEVQMEPLGPFTPFYAMKDGAYKRLRRGVSARLSHTLVIERRYDATRLGASDRTFAFTLRRDRPEQTADTIYTAFLIAMLDEPIDPTWAGWLWRRAQARGEARPLTVWGTIIRETWECDIPTTLRGDISAARAGTSPYGDLPVLSGEAAA